MKHDLLCIISCCASLVALPPVAIADQAADKAAIEKAHRILHDCVQRRRRRSTGRALG